MAPLMCRRRAVPAALSFFVSGAGSLPSTRCAGSQTATNKRSHKRRMVPPAGMDDRLARLKGSPAPVQSCPGSALQVEADALRERQCRTPVDRAGLPAHVRFPGVGARFAAATRFLFTAEGTADFGTRGADIDVGNTAVAALGR